jgi:DNA mismatch repair protein MutS
MDEIGRGTSTYDGMSIARAVLEYCADKKRLGCKTLFATHYHEVTAVEQEIEGVKNYHIAAKKRADDIVFLRKIVPGATDDSFGIEVAKLAGLPNSVVSRARQILEELETDGAPQPKVVKPEPDDQISMMDLSAQQVRTALESINIETLTPIEAMNELYKLKKMLE